jgi:hypothetical protein
MSNSPAHKCATTVHTRRGMAHLRTTQAIDKANEIIADCISSFNVRQNHLTRSHLAWSVLKSRHRQHNTPRASVLPGGQSKVWFPVYFCGQPNSCWYLDEHGDRPAHPIKLPIPHINTSKAISVKSFARGIQRPCNSSAGRRANVGENGAR